MLSALVFYLFSRVQTKQFQPRGVHSAEPREMVKNGGTRTFESVLSVLFLPLSPHHRGREREDSCSNIPLTGSKLVFSISMVKSSPLPNVTVSSPALDQQPH